jgi:hypothetical protein
MPPFKHTPLISPHTEMRLLKLYLSGPDDDIRCEISPYVISSAPVYTALSYEWGESTLPVEILVNGRIFSARHNLWLFLHRMKVTAAQKCSSCSQGKSTHLWIDALCIDQTNNKERGAKVQLMDSIKEVVVWLGWWEEFNAKAANKLNARLYHITKSGQNHANFDSSGLCCMFQTTKVDTDATDEEVYDFISVICKASYWTRRWIVQEIGLAKTVLLTFGRHKLPWDALCLAFDREEQRRLFRLPIPSEAPVLKSTAYQVWSHRISVKLDNNENTLFHLLKSYRSLQCSNFYDRVYSLASIATHERFKIDCSISALEFFSRVLSSNHFGDSSLLDWQNIATDCGCATSEEMLNKASHPELQISRVTTRISHLVEILEVYEWGAVESAFTNILMSPELCDALRTFAATVTTRNLRSVSATSSCEIDASHENSVGREQPWPMVNPQSQSGGASCDGIDAKLISFRESSPRSPWLLGVSSSVEVGDMLCAVHQYTSLILRRIPGSSEKLRVVGGAFTPGIDIRDAKWTIYFNGYTPIQLR